MNDSGLDILGAVVFTTVVAVTIVIIKVILRVGLTVLFLSLPDILDLSFYSVIEDD
jgi:hypothetical protein